MSLLYLIRHGETDWNYKGRIQSSSDVPLNRVGMDQMRSVATYLARLDMAPCLLLSSDASRCQVSAEIIGKELATAAHTEVSLREVDFGVWAGREISDLRRCEDQRNAWDNMVPNHVWEGGESFDVAHQRAHKCISGWLANTCQQNVVAVTHGIIIQLLVSWWIAGNLSCSNRLTVSNGSVSLLNVRKDGSATILGLNILPWSEVLKDRTNRSYLVENGMAPID